MANTTLVAIYNHNFPKNVDKLEKIYSARFDKICHIMPFYIGEDKRIISVYENSYQFEGYITQGFDCFYNDEAEYFVFMADDVLLHPDLSKDTIEQMLKIDENTGFTARNIRSVSDKFLIMKRWLFPTIINYMYSDFKSFVDKILPTPEEMFKKYEQMEIPLEKLSENKIKYIQDFYTMDLENFFYKYRAATATVDLKKLMAKYVEDTKTPFRYLFPFACGFSDFFVVPKKFIKDFMYLCGVFAAMRIFVEVAIPTALMITLDKLMCPKNIGMDVVNFPSDPQREKFSKENDFSVKKVLADWNKENLLVHPIKYSMWEVDID